MKYSQIEAEILQKVANKIHQPALRPCDQVRPHQTNHPARSRQPGRLCAHDLGPRLLHQEDHRRRQRVRARIKADADKTAAITLADAESLALRLKGQGEAGMIESLQILQQNPSWRNST